MGALARKDPSGIADDRSGWRPGDFVARPTASIRTFDYWNPASARHEPADLFKAGTASSPKSSPNAIPLDLWLPRPPDPTQKNVTEQPQRDGRASGLIVLSAQDPWNPIGLPTSLQSRFAGSDNRWFEAVELPRFDPNAQRATWATDSFDRPLTRDARSKAKWIVAILQPSSIAQRARWLRDFEAVFLDLTQERFFRKIRSLAQGVETAEPLLAAIEIKNIWEDRHEFHRRRTRGNRFGTNVTDGGTLSWPMALRIAEARCDYDTWNMIDPTWLDDWQRLRWSADGYWFFADYAVWRAECERFEDWDLVASLRHEEARWTGGGRMPTDSVSGMSVNIRGRPGVPAEIVKRYGEWREERDPRPRRATRMNQALREPEELEDSNSSESVREGKDDLRPQRDSGECNSVCESSHNSEAESVEAPGVAIDLLTQPHNSDIHVPPS